MNPNQGNDEGSGTVRPYENAVYTYPPVSDLFCVLIEPVIEGETTAVTLTRTAIQNTHLELLIGAVMLLVVLSVGSNSHAGRKAS